MVILIVSVFILGYLAIALEQFIRIDKGAIAIFMAAILWSLLNIASPESVSGAIMEQLGSVCSTVVFLFGAMTIVTMVDAHGGFAYISSMMNGNHKKRLLWSISILTFFMSAVLDNMTTTIIMIAILNKLLSNKEERLIYASMIVIAANAGGAWSPIGDVTTIMLWVGDNVTTGGIISKLILPSLAALLVPLIIETIYLRKDAYGFSKVPNPAHDLEVHRAQYPNITDSERKIISILGVGGLLFVPVFRQITGLAPFMGVVFVTGVLWLVTELIYGRKIYYGKKDVQKVRIKKVIQLIDLNSLMFFFGILMSVAVLEVSGALGMAANALDKNLHNIPLIAGSIGVLSSIIDNVPLVAASIGMYPIADPTTVQAGSYISNFVTDGEFWQLIAYCAGIGGSLLIIGSAAGVVAMGMEKISFGWYLKHISWKALLGYLAGMMVYMLF
jgi:Na+/H+ antiporter NhaD/arsenite permease-like protein